MYVYRYMFRIICVFSQEVFPAQVLNVLYEFSTNTLTAVSLCWLMYVYRYMFRIICVFSQEVFPAQVLNVLYEFSANTWTGVSLPWLIYAYRYMFRTSHASAEEFFAVQVLNVLYEFSANAVGVILVKVHLIWVLCHVNILKSSPPWVKGSNDAIHVAVVWISRVMLSDIIRQWISGAQVAHLMVQQVTVRNQSIPIME